MAERPAFFVSENKSVGTRNYTFEWFPGFSVAQKQRSIAALHTAIQEMDPSDKPLEISSKSTLALGQSLSAFNLKLEAGGLENVPLECVFQASKKFKSSGQHPEFLHIHPREAKRAASELHNEDSLLGFVFNGNEFALEPKTHFYDWIYIRSVLNSGIDLNRLKSYTCFTDIEFNPKKSHNCQAYSLALLMTMLKDFSASEIVQFTPADFLAYYN